MPTDNKAKMRDAIERIRREVSVDKIRQQIKDEQEAITPKRKWILKHFPQHIEPNPFPASERDRLRKKPWRSKIERLPAGEEPENTMEDETSIPEEEIQKQQEIFGPEEQPEIDEKQYNQFVDTLIQKEGMDKEEAQTVLDQMYKKSVEPKEEQKLTPSPTPSAEIPMEEKPEDKDVENKFKSIFEMISKRYRDLQKPRIGPGSEE